MLMMGVRLFLAILRLPRLDNFANYYHIGLEKRPLLSVRTYVISFSWLVMMERGI